MVEGILIAKDFLLVFIGSLDLRTFSFIAIISQINGLSTMCYFCENVLSEEERRALILRALADKPKKYIEKNNKKKT